MVLLREVGDGRKSVWLTMVMGGRDMSLHPPST